MSPCIQSNNMSSATKNAPVLQSAQSRDQILSGIASRRGIQRQLEAEYIAWSIPKARNEEARGRAQAVKINLLGLCSPGHTLFETTANSTSSSTGSPDPSKQLFQTRQKLERFTSTIHTRCVRDIKRIFSWKVYGVSCNRETNEEAHYVRVSFVDRVNDRAFEKLTELLDAIVAKRHVALEDVRPFGVGVDSGVPVDHERIYLINNCAKQTPFLRKVTVDFEVFLDNEWKRLDLKIDRFGFATYKSVAKETLVQAQGPEDVQFSDDPYVRFARMTLRFGERPERAFIDIEGGEKAIPHISRTRKASIVYLPKVRVRINDGNVTRRPIQSMTRLIFREKDGFLRGSYGKYAAAEAEKMAKLISKTTALAARNTLGIRPFVADSDIVPMAMGGIISQKPYVFRLSDDPSQLPRAADITAEFTGATMYAVPRGGGGGLTLVSQSADGEYVLRQHIENPVGLISCVTARGFNVSSSSTLITARSRTRYTGTGTLRYTFSHGETDAEALVSQLVALLNSIDAAQHLPSRLPLLTKVLAQKQRTRSAARARASHSRSSSNASDTSNFSDTSNVSIPDSITESDSSDLDSPLSASDRGTSELAFLLYEAPDTAVHEAPDNSTLVLCEAPGDFGGVEVPALEIPAREMPADSKLCRARVSYMATLPREVTMREGGVVSVEYRNVHWAFVRVAGGEEGWVPTRFLDIRE
ncbi:hypothetical protein EDC01DRAFT_628345 [Geopyxis carbonaria]|nr:hypothetical protein EDC01DRAFT_628345 [Geopyxis carbonaria]